MTSELHHIKDDRPRPHDIDPKVAREVEITTIIIANQRMGVLADFNFL